MSAFSENLKNLRNSKNMSMDEIVKKLNNKYELKFTKTTWSRWESGETSPTVEHASALAKFFGYSLDELTQTEINLGKSDAESPNSSRSNKVDTVAAHIDDDVTEEELVRIREYIDYIKSKRG